MARMAGMWRNVGLGIAAAATVLVGTAGLSGCGDFFVCQKASCSTSGTGTSGTGNYAYVSNNSLSATEISGYALGKSTLALATSAPYTTGITPTAMVVSHANGFLYVASTVSATTGEAGIYGFTIGTGGALAVLSTGLPLVATTTAIAAMDVSPDGDWLVVASVNNGVTQSTVTAYPLNASTGAIGSATAVAYAPLSGSIVSTVKVAPSGQFISVALGLGGFVTFPFATSTGTISAGTTTSFNSASVGAYDLAIDANNYLYVAATGNIYVFSVSTAGVPALSATSTTPTAAGGPFAVALDGASYLYASALSGTTELIYEYSLNAGVLTPLSTATISAPATTTKMAVDSTGGYLLAQGYDTAAGLKLYSISSGVLTSLDTAGTGSSQTISSALALTH